MAKVKSGDAMDAVLANVEKALGHKDKTKTIFSRFGKIEREDIKVIPFGIPAIDEASYCGGVGRGKMVEIYGPESSGKSLLSYYLIGSAQKMGLEAALLDVEQSFDPDWASRHTVDVDKLIYANEFASGNEALDGAYELCLSGALGIVVIDSTAALLPQSELENALTDNAQVGAQAAMMSRACRKINDACGRSGTTCIFINQVREKIGVMFGNNETTPGGRALKFYCHQRIRACGIKKITQKSALKDQYGKQETLVIGQQSEIKFVKNKVARPWGKAIFDIIYDASSTNPVIIMCNALKEMKMVKSYKNILQISKGTLDKAAIDTGETTMIGLANYLIAKDLVLPLVDKLIEASEDDPDIKIDEAILEMKADPTKIVSPSNTGAALDVKRGNDEPEVDDPEELPPEE